MKEIANDELRIVDQVRTKTSFEYCFASKEAHLTLHVEQSGAAPEAWRVDARGRPKAGGEACTATATAATRVDALRATAAEWRDGRARPSVDWEAVERMLQQVRAL